MQNTQELSTVLGHWHQMFVTMMVGLESVTLFNKEYEDTFSLSLYTKSVLTSFGENLCLIKKKYIKM